MNFLIFFISGLILSLIFTPIIRRISLLLSVVDSPDKQRKMHTRPTPLLGGVGVFFAFVTVLIIYINFGHPNLVVVPKHFLMSLVLGGVVLLLGGILDDKFDLSPALLWVFPAIAAMIVVVSGVGIGITELSNPLGGTISLNFKVIGIPAAGALIWLWLMGMMFTTKFLDGLDGLVSGIGVIASITLFALSLTARIDQPITASVSIILAGCLLGFLVYNFHPASIFLGESGSTFIGFALGVISVLLGGKIATAFLVMGIPILDVAWVIGQRILRGKSPFRADRLHLHFRLLDAGFSVREAVVSLYCIAAIFGFTAVFLQSLGKLIALIFLLLIMIATSMFVRLGSFIKRSSR